MNEPTAPFIPLPFSKHDSHSRLPRETTQILTKFLEKLAYNSTVILSYESYREDVHTISLIRESHDSNLSYIETHSLIETPDEPSFSIPFTSTPNSNETFR